MLVKCARHDFVKQHSESPSSFDNNRHEVFAESRDDVALLNNLVETLEAGSDAHTELIVASEEAGKATLALLLLIAHIGHVDVLLGEMSKVEENVSVKGAFGSEISESGFTSIDV